MPPFRRWRSNYDSAVLRSNRLTNEVNKGYPSCAGAQRDLLGELQRVRQPVMELYANGEVSPGPPVGKAATSKAAGPAAVRGEVNKLVASSACTVAEYRKAIREEDEGFFAGLAGKTVVLRGMLLARLEEADGQLLARVLAGGGEVGAGFPPKCAAMGLMPGKSIVLSGEPHKTKSGWVLRVAEWGVAADVDRGRPMSPCKWPEPQASPGEDGPERR